MTRLVRSALRNLKGIVSFEVDWDTADATVVYDRSVISYKKIHDILTGAGFKVTKKE